MCNSPNFDHDNAVRIFFPKFPYIEKFIEACKFCAYYFIVFELCRTELSSKGTFTLRQTFGAVRINVAEVEIFFAQ